ncbi:MAG: malate dehydrogenase [Candidatus Aminicenantes bacterium]|nr:malate dehydrogenase [Candidatus Aminicenantes bacterium]MBL7083096.1 malate dehydrogenase [Candidatus Aminicenantes bacterium]
MRKKITVIGAGHVGEVTAFKLAEKELGDVVLLDVIEDMPIGKGLDMREGGPVGKYDSAIVGTNSYGDTANSDIIVITAGKPRTPGMSRDELVESNFNIVKPVTEEIIKHSPNAMILVVANPLDAMAYTAFKVSGFPKNKVFGMAGILDTTRFRAFISMELNVSVENIQALVLGGHGDTMVPIARYTTVSGIPLSHFLPQDRIDAIIERTRKGGGEIVKYLKTGSAYYAPSLAVAEMVESIVKDKKKVLPCSAYLEGEYGINDLYFGVPIKLGANGVEEIIEIDLTDEEKEAIKSSEAAVRSVIDLLKF